MFVQKSATLLLSLLGGRSRLSREARRRLALLHSLAESSRNFCTAGIWCSEQQHLSELLKHISSFAIGMLQALLLAA
jgi:hypothetical protein